MYNEQILIIIKIVSIVFLTTMMITLAAATRLKNGECWAAMIVVMTNMPLIIANLVREILPEYYLFFIYPAYSVNLLGLPAIWFFTRSQMDKSFRITRRSLLHGIPALVSLVVYMVYYVPLTPAQVEAEMELIKAGGKNLPAIVNDSFLNLQLPVYFTCIVRYVYKRMKYLRDNFSDVRYNEIRWVPRFLIFYSTIIIISAVAYAIDSRTETWLCPILLMAVMAYLVYCVIYHSTTAYINRLPDEMREMGEKEEMGERGEERTALSSEQMKEICDKVMNYLTASGAFTNPDFSLSMLSVGTGIANKNLSRSINGYMKKNFFKLINEMRIEDTKKRLLSLEANQTIESVAEKCGFHSRATFFSAFKKAVGKTPAQWLESRKLVQKECFLD